MDLLAQGIALGHELRHLTLNVLDMPLLLLGILAHTVHLADALTAWLAASNIITGPIFRRIRGAATVAEPLSAEAVALTVKRRAQLAGLEGDFGAHSLRSGLVTEAGRQNVPLGDTMAMTGHRSIQTVMRYFQAGAIGQIRVPGYSATIPQATEEPPILWNFIIIVCVGSPYREVLGRGIPPKKCQLKFIGVTPLAEP